MAKQKREIKGFDPLEPVDEPVNLEDLIVNLKPTGKIYTGIIGRSEEQIANEQLAKDPGTLLIDKTKIVEAGELPVLLKREPGSKVEGEPKIIIDGERWFSYQQLSKILMCTHASIFNYVKKGKVEVKKIDGMKFYRLNGYM